MSEPAIGPCVYPGCSDINGDPELTDQTMCDPCRRRYRKTLRWLVEDFVILRGQLPKPAGHAGPKVSASREPGHPAEWASDTAQRIADVLNWTEDALREHLQLLPPPHPLLSPNRIVRHAFTTLQTHFDGLCTFPGAQAAAVEITGLHRDIRARLGQTRERQHVSTPCPDCGLITLVREVGLDRSDLISCTACGREIQEAHHALYARIVLNELLEVG